MKKKKGPKMASKEIGDSFFSGLGQHRFAQVDLVNLSFSILEINKLFRHIFDWNKCQAFGFVHLIRKSFEEHDLCELITKPEGI
jgi:hypothetical protein